MAKAYGLTGDSVKRVRRVVKRVESMPLVNLSGGAGGRSWPERIWIVEIQDSGNPDPQLTAGGSCMCKRLRWEDEALTEAPLDEIEVHDILGDSTGNAGTRAVACHYAHADSEFWFFMVPICDT